MIDIGEKVAIKAMQKSRISDYEAFQNEISILRSLVSSIFRINFFNLFELNSHADHVTFCFAQDHPNIIKLFETWETERICFLVTE